MIRLEAMPEFGVHRRRHWVVLTIGADRYLLDASEAVGLADLLVDHAEQEVAR